MIPCAWAFLKRRRAKDYIRLFKSLILSVNELGYILKPEYVMIDFELAAAKSFQICFPGIRVRDELEGGVRGG